MPLWAPLVDRMLELICHKPDLTRRELEAELKTHLSVQTLCRVLQRLLVAVKKVHIAAERSHSDVAEQRETLNLEQPYLHPEHFVFIDRTWAKNEHDRFPWDCGPSVGATS
jgi:hypothetical protein